MNLPFLYEMPDKQHLYPFTLTRAVQDIRVGITTIAEKWAAIPDLPESIRIAENWLPSEELISLLRSNAFHHPALKETALKIEYPWHIVQLNDLALRYDFEVITRGRSSQPLPESVQAVNVSHIFIEEGARVGYCTLNASTGPIYIGRNAEIMEGSLIRGPFALCEGGVVKMGARIYGATTIGPYSTVGGEIKNSVIFGFSNKAHDGYLGDSVIGEWCNLGAGTSNSNLKNTAGEVKVWNQPSNSFISAGRKCGLLMGDYSRSAINTSFNTGTVVGVCSNVFGEGLMPKHIAAFTWGGKESCRYELEKAITDVDNWKKLKGSYITEQEKLTLKHIFDQNIIDNA